MVIGQEKERRFLLLIWLPGEASKRVSQINSIERSCDVFFQVNCLLFTQVNVDAQSRFHISIIRSVAPWSYQFDDDKI